MNEFQTGDKVTVTRGSSKGQTGTLRVAKYDDGMVQYSVTFDNGCRQILNSVKSFKRA